MSSVLDCHALVNAMKGKGLENVLAVQQRRKALQRLLVRLRRWGFDSAAAALPARFSLQMHRPGGCPLFPNQPSQLESAFFDSFQLL